MKCLHSQSQAVQDFLLQTSILRRFCVPLCEGVTDLNLDESQEILAEIERQNLFPGSPGLSSGAGIATIIFFKIYYASRLQEPFEQRRAWRHFAQQSQCWLAGNGFIEEALIAIPWLPGTWKGPPYWLSRTGTIPWTGRILAHWNDGWICCPKKRFKGDQRFFWPELGFWTYETRLAEFRHSYRKRRRSWAPVQSLGAESDTRRTCRGRSTRCGVYPRVEWSRQPGSGKGPKRFRKPSTLRTLFARSFAMLTSWRWHIKWQDRQRLRCEHWTNS